MKQQNKQKGFTLIELMIVVAIVGILAAIAYPSYQESTAKSRRANAQAELMSLSSAMERYYTANNHYSNAAAGGADIGVPAGTLYSVEPNVLTYYDITIAETDGVTSDTTSAQSYDLEAVPKGAMSGDRCGTMSLSSTGVKGVSTAATDCWK